MELQKSLNDTFHITNNHLIHSDTGNKVSKIYSATLLWLLAVKTIHHQTIYGSKQEAEKHVLQTKRNY